MVMIMNDEAMEGTAGWCPLCLICLFRYLATQKGKHDRTWETLTAVRVGKVGKTLPSS